nr:MEDS domain-containing protein [Deltaproteobacteria bacterium]
MPFHEARAPLDTHVLVLGRGEDFLCESVADYLADGLFHGEGLLVIANPERWLRITAGLVSRRWDVQRALQEGKVCYVSSDAELARLRAGGHLDAEALDRDLTPLISALREATGQPQIRAFGDMVSTLWQEGHHATALTLEYAWHDFIRLEPVTLLCAYEADPLDETIDAPSMLKVCRAHGQLAACEHRQERQAAIAVAMDEVLGIREVGRLHLVLASEGLPTARVGADEVALLWLRAEV